MGVEGGGEAVHEIKDGIISVQRPSFQPLPRSGQDTP
jgi:hypothetical protein